MKIHSFLPRTLFSLIAGFFFVFSSTLSVADTVTTVDRTAVDIKVDSQEAGDFQIFYLSRGYSNLFTEDPRRIDMDALVRMGIPKPQLIFTTRAYSNAIYSYPQPSVNEVSDDPLIVYVDKGYGQAIYSYPGNVGRGFIIGLPREVY